MNAERLYEITNLYRALEEEHGSGPALAIIGARFSDAVAEELRQSLEDAGEFSPPKTYADGWREALEAAAAELEMYGASPINPNIERGFARSFATTIRNLKEPTNEK